MPLLEWFRRLARYNTVANARVYQACSVLPEGEYRQARTVSFGSIHALLNHLLLGDRIWMGRFEGGGATTPPLSTILHDDFPPLHDARVREDARIERFFETVREDWLTRPIVYVNSKGVKYREEPTAAAGHFFNHQTHHRGQLHVLLAQSGVAAPSLDLHRILNP